MTNTTIQSTRIAIVNTAITRFQINNLSPGYRVQKCCNGTVNIAMNIQLVELAK